ncbi:hypothetical protein O6H91_01G171600 [Diphasiastrum complanatum]|uniref:Uncharacterized protein n=1 Tax=Diphasiastrum complanatum TaxID=34168 RepID=A0ACC2EZ19_DIPCM|nr:hypothetical protein O6H91_01G171600 [Diphasiastrum complanatum]
MGEVMTMSEPSYEGALRQLRCLKVSSEYDSEGSTVVNKISARIFNGLAKLKGSIQRESTGEFRYPTLALASKYLSVLYDHEDRNALVTLSAELGRNLQLKYLQDIKAQQGEAKLLATSTNLKYKLELACDTPFSTLPRAAFTFPNGEVKLEEEIREDTRALSISGFVGGTLRDGLFLAEYKEENFGLKYKYKDEEMTLTPSVAWPSKSISLAFKRQFDPINKLSYFYNFNTEAWSAVYELKPSENFKVKLGYDSEVGVSWASAWVGKEDAGAKKAPRKCKLQVMLQVPHEDIKATALLFRIKKRWDI